MSLRELFSDREPDLPRLYAYPDGRWLRANMVATADGAASLSGVTRYRLVGLQATAFYVYFVIVLALVVVGVQLSAAA